MFFILGYSIYLKNIIPTMTGSFLTNLKVTVIYKGEDTLWNISFRLFYETQFNVYFITSNLISRNPYKICKKETSTIKKKGIQKKPEVCNFIKKDTLAQVFSCEFCEISQNRTASQEARK